MPNLFGTPSQALPALQPQTSDPTIPNMPAQGSATMTMPSVDQLARILGNSGNSQPSAPPPAPIGNQLGYGQDTSQMTAQGYPVGGSAQQANINNAMGMYGQQMPAMQNYQNTVSRGGWYGS